MTEEFKNDAYQDRSLIVERSIVVSGGAFVACQDGSTAPRRGVHLSGEKVHALIEALKPFAVEPEEPLADWERELLGHVADAVVEEEEKKRFEVGQRVWLTGPHYIADGHERTTFDEAPHGRLSTATIVEPITVWGEGAAYRVRWDDNGRRSVVATGSLSALDFPVGTRVRVSAHFTHHFEDGALGVVESVGGAYGDRYRLVRCDAPARTGAKVQTVRVDHLEVFEPEEPGNVVGTIAYVTGDSDEWGHLIEPGTAVEIVKDDVALDGSYDVRLVKAGGGSYVGANDLSIDSPHVQEIPDGAEVKILDDGHEHGLRHYLNVGQVGKVVGFRDTSADPHLTFNSAYIVEGYSDEVVAGRLTQSVLAESVEVFDPLDPARFGGLLRDFLYPSRYALGVDPATKTWEEILRGRPYPL